MSGGPRSIGPITKAAGGLTGIGLQNDDENREGTVTIVASVAADSPFAGMLEKDDEILEVNGVNVRGKAKMASQKIVEAVREHAPMLLSGGKLDVPNGKKLMDMADGALTGHPRLYLEVILAEDETG